MDKLSGTKLIVCDEREPFTFLPMNSYIDEDRASVIAAQLRSDKASGRGRHAGVAEHLEIVLIPREAHGLYTLYPGLFLFTTPARMIRPVLNLITNTTEYVGTFEQVYLGICITHDEFVPGVS
jgi:DNA-directed RNA polymerase I subunit RPA2